MHNLNRRGVAEIVQVLLITVLSILAIATVSKYVLSATDILENQLSPAVDCLTMKSKVISACQNSNNQIEVNVELASNENSNLKISTNSEVFSCNGQSCSTCSLKEGRQIIYINSQTTTPEISYQFSNCPAQQIRTTVCATP